VGLWKNIRKGWSLLSSHTKLILGKRSRIYFWDDVWCGEMPLKEAFPVLYDIALDKDALIADHLVVVSGSYQWMLASFKRPTTGRWLFWLPFSLCCTLPKSIVEGKTSSGGLLLTKGNLMLDLSIRLLLVKRLFIFPGKVFGGPRLL
jgi:hypothetical protein